MGNYGNLDLRGLKPREQGPPLTLEDVYISLQVRLNPTKSRHKTEEEKPDLIDMAQLLAQSPRLAIIGGPGSGKSTYLKLIATLLARALQENQSPKVKTELGLSSPLPLPIYIPLSEYNQYRREANTSQDPRTGTLTAYISHALIQQHAMLGLPSDFFEKLLIQGQHCLLLLDGLDEIANENERKLVRIAVEQLAYNKNIRQIIVTSRTRTYQGEMVLPTAIFQLVEVQPMSPEQVSRLVKRWCHAVYEDPAAATLETRQLQQEIDHLEAMRQAYNEPRLLDTPLLVTIVAIVHYDQRRLPDQRAELYDKCIDTFLAERNKPESKAKQSLADWGGSPNEKRNWLAYLAFQMMSAGEAAGREISETQLKTWLRPLIVRRRGEAEADGQLENFMEAMKERGSLLDERSGSYRFTHLTFQEFLAAYHLAETIREKGAIADFLLQEKRVLQTWWRETVLLTVGYLGLRSEDTALALVTELQQKSQNLPDCAVALSATELGAAAFLELQSQATDTRRALAGQLTTLLTNRQHTLAPALRRLAGDTLGRLGDERRGVGLRQITQQLVLPDLVFCYVPAGAFFMGSEDGQENEKGGGDFTIPYDYWIGRYLVTVAQFRLFAQQTNHKLRDYTQQALTQDPTTRPVHYVYWDDAISFCHWLTQHAQQLGWLPAHLTISLPSEAEWEKAARGGRTIPAQPNMVHWGEEPFTPPQPLPTLVPNPLPRRRYPMGDQLDKTMANYKGAGLGSSSPVGVFPLDSSPYQLCDMAGNLNEWTRSLYLPYPYQIDHKHENLQSREPRVLRGGSYYDDANDWLRCAFRGRYSPYSGNHHHGFRVVVSPFPSHL